jgi:hypothetical protein
MAFALSVDDHIITAHSEAQLILSLQGAAEVNRAAITAARGKCSYLSPVVLQCELNLTLVTRVKAAVAGGSRLTKIRRVLVIVVCR